MIVTCSKTRFVRPGYVYVATFGGLSKIGSSSDPWRRVKRLEKPEARRGVWGARKLFWHLKLNPRLLAQLTEKIALNVLMDEIVEGEWLRTTPDAAVNTLTASVEKACTLLRREIVVAESRDWPVDHLVEPFGVSEDIERGDYPAAWLADAQRQSKLSGFRRKIVERGDVE